MRQALNARAQAAAMAAAPARDLAITTPAIKNEYMARQAIALSQLPIRNKSDEERQQAAELLDYLGRRALSNRVIPAERQKYLAKQAATQAAEAAKQKQAAEAAAKQKQVAEAAVAEHNRNKNPATHHFALPSPSYTPSGSPGVSYSGHSWGAGNVVFKPPKPAAAAAKRPAAAPPKPAAAPAKPAGTKPAKNKPPRQPRRPATNIAMHPQSWWPHAAKGLCRGQQCGCKMTGRGPKCCRLHDVGGKKKEKDCQPLAPGGVCGTGEYAYKVRCCCNPMTGDCSKIQELRDGLYQYHRKPDTKVYVDMAEDPAHPRDGAYKHVPYGEVEPRFGCFGGTQGPLFGSTFNPNRTWA